MPLLLIEKLFAEYVTKKISEHPLIDVVHEEITEIPSGPTIIASGPLTSDKLSDSIKSFFWRRIFIFL